MTCRYVACPSTHLNTLGVCQPHWEATLNRALKVWTDKLCRVQGCNGPVKAKGWCSMHYGRMARSGSTSRPRGGQRTPNWAPVTSITAIRSRALALRDTDPSAARRLVAEALQEGAA